MIKIWTSCTTLDIMCVANVSSRPLKLLESRDFVDLELKLSERDGLTTGTEILYTGLDL